VSGRRSEWRSEIPATLDAIEEFCGEFQLWRPGACPGLDAFSAELLLREALTNAVVHGGQQGPHPHICSVLLRARPGRLLIAIKDQGDGFDWRAVWNHDAALSDTNGRGIGIFRRYASSVRFNSKGNKILLVKRF
jgi:anti-sigma regulatory factor (Ser/Thr protein kinase)